MAKTPDAVLSFLNKLLNPSLKKAKMELSELYTFAKELDNLDELQPWDIAYYREKLKQKNFTIDTESLKPYLSLNNVLEGIFKHCQILYQLNFKAVDFIPVYHSEVKTYQVYDNDNNYIGLFYLDLFPRDSKKPGAWMNSFREQGLQQNEVKRPHVIVVCNLTPPTKTKPSLLSLDEVETLFHEFGHALHGLLAKGTYSQVTGTNVKWDFVELPSQIFENWVKEEESLKLFAKHYLTEELLPLTWIEKIKDSAKFFSGYDSLRQLRFGLLDMAWHNNSNTDAISDVIEFEHQALQSLDLLPQIDNSSISTAFMHIFSGGYSAGYYSYKWAEVLDADAFSYFKEKGIFNPEVAKLFKTQILEKGSTEPPMDLYVKFRGQEPNPDALLKREGLC
jgi:peptidyl-dipeptidase Dcp